MSREMRITRRTDEKGLVLESDLLQDARLGREIRVIVREGEIRLLPEREEDDWQNTLDELAGCLGDEPVEAYDFELKLRNPYEA